MADSQKTENPNPPSVPTTEEIKEKEKEIQEKEEDRINKAKTFATNVAAQTKARDTRQAIIDQSYDVSGGNNERCDILGKYMWNIDTYKIGDVSTIPYCYLIEYKQKHNSIISNLINSISAAVTSVGNPENLSSIQTAFTKIKELSSAMVSAASGQLSEDSRKALSGAAKQVSEVASDTADAIEDGVNRAANTQAGQKVSEFGSGLMAALSKGWEMISDSYNTFQQGSDKRATVATGGGYLKPYSQLYWLEPTNKKYTFPMLNELPKHKLSNSYGDNNGDTSILSNNSFIKTMSDILSDVPGSVRDLADLGKIASGSSTSFSGAFVEKAKFFQYPQETEEYTIQFPLINTVRNHTGIPEWKKNYKFIILFSLRNMIFRKDNAEYYPPLFYDLYIPGVIRQPYCYVSSVDAQPFGMTRVKDCTDLFNFDDSMKTIKVPVPEMWIVTIKIKSLIPTSANMVLSSMFDLPINNSTK